MTVKDLSVGEKFYPKSQQFKATPIFEVVDRYDGLKHKVKCRNLQTGALCYKMTSLQVIRTH